MVPEQFAHLKLAPGDLVSLNVLDDEDFKGQFRVGPGGDIAVPELGSVHVAGETTGEARQQIAKLLLDRGLLKDPQVEMDLIQYIAPEVKILGEVGAPGVFPLLAPENLEDVLALAGGPTMMAGDEIVLTQKAGGAPIRVPYSRRLPAESLKQVVVHPGDTIQVMRAGVVYVLGSVTRPGGYIMQEDGKLSVLQAVSIAGGTTYTASTGSIYVMHKNDDGTAMWMQLAYNKMSKGKASDFQLHVNDIIFIPTNRFKATFASTQSVIASAASASIYAAVIY
jgi:polysaccharide export outer membrane protein